MEPSEKTSKALHVLRERDVTTNASADPYTEADGTRAYELVWSVPLGFTSAETINTLEDTLDTYGFDFHGIRRSHSGSAAKLLFRHDDPEKTIIK